MKMILSQNVHSFFIWALLLVFVLVGFLGVGYSGMAIDAKGEMSLCPLMGVSTFCRMNPLEHISTWQKMFVAFPQKDILILLLLALWSISAIFALRYVQRFYLAVPAFCFSISRRAGVPPMCRLLQEAFSDGILNPKIF